MKEEDFEEKQDTEGDSRVFPGHLQIGPKWGCVVKHKDPSNEQRTGGQGGKVILPQNNTFPQGLTPFYTHLPQSLYCSLPEPKQASSSRTLNLLSLPSISSQTASLSDIKSQKFLCITLLGVFQSCW